VVFNHLKSPNNLDVFEDGKRSNETENGFQKDHSIVSAAFKKVFEISVGARGSVSPILGPPDC
jgi:hypothetical protein